ncbi:hypothetical protein [Enterocloster lavalensis]
MNFQTYPSTAWAFSGANQFLFLELVSEWP